MPTLDEKQRAWLDTAVNNRGRFTSKKSVEKDWEDYRRRRAKTATALAELDAQSPQRKMVQQALKDADGLAELGKFSNAYKRLDGAKKLAATTSGQRIDAIAVTTISAEVQEIHDRLYEIVPGADFAVSQLDQISLKLDRWEKVSDAPTFEAATQRRKDLVQDEVPLLAEYGRAREEAETIVQRIDKNNVPKLVAAAELKVQTYEQAGLGPQIAAHKTRLADLKAESLKHAGRYTDRSVLRAHSKTRCAEIEAKLLAIKNFGPYQTRTDTVTADAKTANIRGDLEATTNTDWIDDEAEYQVAAAKRAMGYARTADIDTLADTSAAPVNVVPEPKKFDPDMAFDGVYNGDVPDDITVQQTDQIVTNATKKLRDFIAATPADSDELFDIMMMSKKDLARMANHALTGVDSPNGITESHKVMLARLSDELSATIRANSPNKMADDLSEITIGGEKFTREKDLGAGGFGIARRFRSQADPDKTVVIKSLHCDDPNKWDEKRDAMAAEMRTNQRLSSVDDGGPGADNLLAMSGAAISNDGTLHIMMEDAAGGDISDFANNLAALSNFGMMSPEAHDVLSRDMVQQTLMGMKALEARGLMHNDMKPENMLLTADGKVKIMDFGESRFGDDTGNAPNQVAAAEADDLFNLTPGYASPEQTDDTVTTVTAKSDVFALAGIAKILAASDYSPTSVRKDQKPATALGRMVSAASDPDPSKRPSLDALLGSTFVTANATDHPQEDIDDLRAAAVEMSMVMGRVKANVKSDTLDWKDFVADDPDADTPDPNKDPAQLAQEQSEREDQAKKQHQKAKEEIDALLRQIGSDTAKISDIQFAISGLQRSLDQYPGFIANATSDRKHIFIATADAKIAAIKFFKSKLNDALAAARDTGQGQIDAVAKDKNDTIDLPGLFGGRMTMGDALKKREVLEREIVLMQDDFYAASMEDPENALKNLDETNRRLTEMADQIAFISNALKERVGPEGQYLLSERKLQDISRRFGPLRGQGAATGASDQPEDDAKDVDQIFDKDAVVGQIKWRARV
ncbi:MAG: protein kinase [Rhodobacteraceae bacterium]|nr:protein kinase [Paracoccaceae bacterium]